MDPVFRGSNIAQIYIPYVVGSDELNAYISHPILKIHVDAILSRVVYIHSPDVESYQFIV